jgi:Ser/Thr protein kinase RdoA (MazF antagonist)
MSGVPHLPAEPLPALVAEGPIPPAWAARFGALDRIGSHAGVHVLRRRDPAPVGRFVKVHDEAARGAREGLLLRAGLPLRTPPLRETVPTTAGQLVLVTDDIRAGRPRPLALDPHLLPAAAALLGRLHATPWAIHPAIPAGPAIPTGPAGAAGPAGPAAVESALVPATAWIDRTRRRFRDPHLPEPLRAALAALVLVGDALCHLDLHPSNWILDGDTPVGLLDWSSAGWADPEHDLAALLLAAGGDPAGADGVLAAWAVASGRTADPARVALYLWLLHVERRVAKGTSSPHEAAVAAATTLGRPHGSAPWPRAFPKVEFTGAWQPEVGLWHPIDEPGVDATLRALGLDVHATATYRLHACNDVLRVDLAGAACVLKVYEKPVWGPLFELERHLAHALAGSPATVLAPLSLPDGRSLLRVGPRVAALYPYLGDDRPGSGARDLVRLATAQAALHGAGEDADFPEIERRTDDLPLATVLTHAEPLLDPSLLARIVAAWHWVEERLSALAALPVGLVHGSLHRDHAVSLPDGRIAVLDLEKVRIGPLVHDVVRSAVYAGYRGNDEAADPARIVYYLRAYGRARPFTPDERAALVPSVLLALLRDVKALGQERVPAEAQRRHARVVADFFHNRGNLDGVLRREL